MPDRWTEEQSRAITARGDLHVSAAAGAGKTAVLTERIARLIAEGTEVEELLVVTFTKAAAAEMKGRIASRLLTLSSEASQAGEEELARRLAAASAACERANISTIHSFCGGVLRRNYHEAGIDPGFAVSDGAQADLLAKDALDAVLEEAFLRNESEPDEAFKALLAAVGDDERLAGLIHSVYKYAMAKPEPEAWLDRAVNIYGDGFMESSGQIAGAMLSAAARELQVHLDKATELRTALGDECPKTAATLDDDRSILLSLILTNDYDAMHNALSRVVFRSLTWPKGVDEDQKKPYKDYRKAMKDHVGKLEKLFAFPISEEARFARMLAGPIECLRRLTLAFRDEFTRLKAEAGMIDFTDMEQLTLKVLRVPGVAAEYRQRFKHVFVDEYQDINPAQEAILAAVSRNNRFMVGDVKQSIYRFRQAEPEIFLNKYRTYSGEGGKKRIDLNRNFRSDTAILDSANLLFRRLMRGDEAGEIDYDDNAALVSGRADPPCGE
ncbi:MAG: UvrD-helicase domain-containing protein, partial [Clostridia bacterium]|nr:UvrD-helicase domain-containing protein [Clostridia bacterium]